MEHNTQPTPEDAQQPAALADAAPQVDPASIPRLGNRKLIGKVPVRFLDALILVSAIALVALFVFFLINR